MMLSNVPMFYYVEEDRSRRDDINLEGNAYVTTGFDVNGHPFVAIYKVARISLIITGSGYTIRVASSSVEEASENLMNSMPDAKGYFVIVMDGEAQL